MDRFVRLWRMFSASPQTTATEAPIPIWRIVVMASAVEASLLAAVLGLLQLASRLNGWFDALANFAAVTGALAVLGAILAYFAFDRGRQQKAVLALAAFGLLASVIRIAPELLRTTPHAPESALVSKLRLATFNVWDENFDVPGTVSRIIESDADVVSLQEDGSFLKLRGPELRQHYPYMVQCNPPWACMDAILSKRPILESGSIAPHIPAKDGEISLIWARTTGPDGRPVVLATTHLTWPIPPAPQKLQRAALIEAMRPIIGPDTILAGDFNLTPWSDSLHELDRGLAPMIRRTHGLATWPANIPRTAKPSPFPILPIDQIYAGPAFKNTRLRRLDRAGSDHYGVFALLER